MNAPQKLYKYYSPSRIQFLEDRMVCFSTLPQLNDPFEGVSRSSSLFPSEGAKSIRGQAGTRDFGRELYKGIFERAIAAGWTLEKAQEAARAITDQKDLVEQAKELVIQNATAIASQIPLSHNDFERELALAVGVLCLSANILSAPMWAHYGQQYSGFAIEFLADHPFFHGAGIGQLRPIIYEMRTLPSLADFDDTDFFIRKSLDWSYEQEWRTARMLDGASHVAQGGYHLFEVPIDAVSCVVLGELAKPDVTTAAKAAKLRFGWPIRFVVADRRAKELIVSDTLHSGSLAVEAG